jgi:hypothetical protein
LIISGGPGEQIGLPNGLQGTEMMESSHYSYTTIFLLLSVMLITYHHARNSWWVPDKTRRKQRAEDKLLGPANATNESLLSGSNSVAGISSEGAGTGERERRQNDRILSRREKDAKKAKKINSSSKEKGNNS